MLWTICIPEDESDDYKKVYVVIKKGLNDRQIRFSRGSLRRGWESK